MNDKLFAIGLPTFHCRGCNVTTPHEHWHDAAHGIRETHMVGTERFVCKICQLSTYSRDVGAKDFPFILDKPK